MSGNGQRPYDVLVQKLLLPDDLQKLVKPPFADLGCPLQEASTEDYGLKTLNYFGSTCKGKQVALLHLDGDVTADPGNFNDVAGIASVFATSSIAIFFFAPVKDLSRTYSRMLAAQLKKKNPSVEALEFYDQSDIDLFNAREESERPAFIRLVLGLDELYKNEDPRPRPKLDLSKIQVRVSDIVFERYKAQDDSPRVFFRQIVTNLEWPDGWSWDPPENARAAATGFVSYLIGQDGYPPSSAMKGYHPLGALLKYLIGSVGGQTANEIYHLIARNQLIDLEDVMADLKTNYCTSDD